MLKYSFENRIPIKSKFIIKKIFSHLEYITKLKMVNFNKHLQNVLNIGINDYKFSSKKYKVTKDGMSSIFLFERNILVYQGQFLNGKRNGPGKEYYNNGKIIKFEGEYLNDKEWNGKGYNNKGETEYEIKNGIKIFWKKKKNGIIEEYSYNDKNIKFLSFKGNYLNGKRNGKGKEFYESGKLKSEGEYLNGQKHGIHKEYKQYYDRKYLDFEGEYINGKKSGKGKDYYYNFDNKIKIFYEGEYLNGKRNGQGKEYYYNGKLRFEGEYSNDETWNGKGYNINGDFEYELKNGSGKVKIYHCRNEKLIFEGEYLKKKKIGQGKEYYSDGKLKFEGEYIDNKEWNGIGYDEKGNVEYELKNGYGIMREYSYNRNDKKIIIFEGEYFGGKRNGIGIEYDKEGYKIFKGEYLNGNRNGKGQEFKYSYLVFDGEYLNGKKIGFGIGYFNKKRYEGEYFNGERIGKGKELNDKNKLIYEGEFLCGQFNGKGKKYDSLGYLEFEGEYINGLKFGKGREYYSDFDKLRDIGKYFYLNQNDKCKYTKLKFEGEYFYDKRNGQGKEYYENGKLKFEGEYKNDKRWNGKGYNNKGDIAYEIENGNGIVKEYYADDKLIIENEYKNGEKIGLTKEYYNNELVKNKIYDYDGELIYTEINNGRLMIGKGKEYRNGILIYEGQYIDGYREGKQKKFYSDGKLAKVYNFPFQKEYEYYDNLTIETSIEYKGEFMIKNFRYFYNNILTCEINRINKEEQIRKIYDLNSKLRFEGLYSIYGQIKNGKCYDVNGNVEFEIKDGKGKAKMYDYNGELKFDGEFLNGEMWKGRVRYFYGDKLKFEGEYKNGKRNGRGKAYASEGKIEFEGEYLNDQRWNGKVMNYSGLGKYLYFKGEYLNGEISGKCQEFYDNGNLKFEGDYLNGKRNGKGKEYYYNGNLAFEGEFVNDKRNGIGKEYDKHGYLDFEGQYLEGDKHGKGKNYFYGKDIVIEGKFSHGRRV